ncbi:hypothetical protein Micbo1qcDRAFT_177126 [Microdochium bolleyi]|uniref:Uncharacterized protein n=1 Tax=Microdochium bolleyi TaxID=196109 RepID=A0A136IYS0_9PEZI|nr:hypothetical protein Micbo1qcDRAFT_177126 [Microdochium bolleyi]
MAIGLSLDEAHHHKIIDPLGDLWLCVRAPTDVGPLGHLFFTKPSTRRFACTGVLRPLVDRWLQRLSGVCFAQNLALQHRLACIAWELGSRPLLQNAVDKMAVHLSPKDDTAENKTLACRETGARQSWARSRQPCAKTTWLSTRARLWSGARKEAHKIHCGIFCVMREVFNRHGRHLDAQWKKTHPDWEG